MGTFNDPCYVYSMYFKKNGLAHDTCHEMEMDWLAPFGEFQMGAGCIGETGTQGGRLERGCPG